MPKHQTSIKQKYPTFKAKVRDLLSGIASERSIVVKLDDQKVIAEYDPEKHLVKYTVEEPLSIGVHSVSVWATDNSRNETYVEHIFNVMSYFNCII